MTPVIAHDAAGHRFETTVEGEHCVLEYEIGGRTMTITHVSVPDPVSRRGIAAALMRDALETARQRGWQVVPSCPYAAYFLKENPEWSGLIAPD
jgi:predicted GNAT family acetyltransferase